MMQRDVTPAVVATAAAGELAPAVIARCAENAAQLFRLTIASLRQ